jgi:prepilin signal peptidase PulO-like enzyme (type II secretory pathway)
MTVRRIKKTTKVFLGPAGICGALLVCIIMCFSIYGVKCKSVVYAGCMLMLCLAACIDAKEHRIPNTVNLGIFALGVVRVVSEHNCVEAIEGMLAVSVPMLACTLAVRGAFGMGDIKLCGAAGAVLGASAMLTGTVAALLAAGIAGGIKLIRKKAAADDRLALGPYLAAGFIFAILSPCIICPYCL